MRSHRRPALLNALLALAVALPAACSSGADQGTSTTTTVEMSTVVSERPSTTIGARTTTTSIATTSTDPPTTTEAAAIEIVVEGGEVVSGPDRIEAELGSTVMFVVRSDAVDHVHVHGYDMFFDVAPGTPAEVQFTADVPGIFEIELEESHMLLVELEVS